MEDVVLLDTPKRTDLQKQAAVLRTALKTFEHDFAEQHGRKPLQADIKQDPTIAKQYKRYQRIQQVQAGKLTYAELNERKEKKPRSKKPLHDRQDSGYGTGLSSGAPAPEEEQHDNNNSGIQHDEGTPSRRLPRVIGPTPHRDGKVLGFFDLLQTSTSRHGSGTLSSSTRKRKIAQLYNDSPIRPQLPRASIAVKSASDGCKIRSSLEPQDDLLDHLTGTPAKVLLQENCAGKHSRTPVSEGKKFELSHFFATPSTNRILLLSKHDSTPSAKDTSCKEVLLAAALGQTPQRQPDLTGKDATPAYFKRSTSFKDRLLGVSASRPASSDGLAKSRPTRSVTGPPTLRHFRSSTDNVFRPPLQEHNQTVQAVSHSAAEEECDGYDDEMAALHEIEDYQAKHVLVEDSHIADASLVFDDDHDTSTRPQVGDKENSRKPYQKKGQKRTTRKANIRVSASVPTTASTGPKFVAADASDEEEDEEIVEETQFPDEVDVDEFHVDERGSRKGSGSQQGRTKSDKNTKKARKQAGTIDPNAQSHQNFRSLKIRNKATTTGGGRARFGRRK